MSIFRGLSVAQNILSVLEIRLREPKAERLTALDQLLAEFFDYASARRARGAGRFGRRTAPGRDSPRPRRRTRGYVLLDEPFAGGGGGGGGVGGGGGPDRSGPKSETLVADLKTRGLGVLITRSQCARNPRHRGPRLYSGMMAVCCALAPPPLKWLPMRRCAGSILGATSGWKALIPHIGGCFFTLPSAIR